MNEAHRNASRAGRKCGHRRLGIVSPDGRQGMLDHAAQLHDAGIPFMFDPGQGLPMFDGADLRHFVERATWVAVNDYEARLLVDRTGWSEEAGGRQGPRPDRHPRCARAPRSGPAASASRFPPSSPGRFSIPPAVVTPTGPASCTASPAACPGRDTGRLASLLGALKIAHKGTQNHTFTPASLATGIPRRHSGMSCGSSPAVRGRRPVAAWLLALALLAPAAQAADGVEPAAWRRTLERIAPVGGFHPGGWHAGLRHRVE